MHLINLSIEAYIIINTPNIQANELTFLIRGAILAAFMYSGNTR